jgi:hypothetical protein
MLQEWKQPFIVQKKLDDRYHLVGRSMHRIYKAARQCGYLKDIIEPIDPREAKKFFKRKNCLSMHRKPRGTNGCYDENI